MSLMCKVQITLNDMQGRAGAVEEALEPDNVDFPEGLSLAVENLDSRLILTFEARQDIRKMIGSIDEVLGHVQVALQVIK